MNRSSPPLRGKPGAFALGMACLGWLSYFSLTPFSFPDGGWPTLWSTLSDAAWTWSGAMPSVRGILPYVPIALAWQLAFTAPYAAIHRRLLAGAGIWLGLSLCGLVITLVQHTPMAQLTPSGNPWSQQIGIGIGLLAGTFAGLLPLRPRADIDLAEPLRPLGWTLLFLALFLPLEPHSRLTDLDWRPITVFTTSLPLHVYLLIKSFILWVPLGLVYGLGGRQTEIKTWVRAGIAGFLLEGAVFVGSLQVTDLWAVAIVPLAVWMGLQLAGATRTSLQHGPAVPPPGTARAKVKMRGGRVAAPGGYAPSRQPVASGGGYTHNAANSRQTTAPIRPGTPPPVSVQPLGQSPGSAAIPAAPLRAGRPRSRGGEEQLLPPTDLAPATGDPPTASGNGVPLPRPTPRGARPAPGPAALNPRVWKVVLRVIALCLFTFIAYKAYTFPRIGPWLTGGLTAYALLLWRWPGAWLLLLPATLPLLDLAPWTGRFYFDGFDLVMLVSIAMALWHGRAAPLHSDEYDPSHQHRGTGRPLPKALLLALACFAVSWLISLVIGLWPIQALDANAFSSYWSHWNSLRVGKGLLWALAVLLMLSNRSLPAVTTQRLYSAGILIGLAGVSVIGLRERWLFAGLFDLDQPYRIVATFSSMHTGGGHIEAYLVMCIPFLWLWLTRGRNPLLVVGAMVLLLLGTYVTLSTISRGGVAALLAGFAVLLLSSLRRNRHHGGGATAMRYALPLVVLLGAGGLLVVGSGSGYFHQRMTQIDQDWQTRVAHWRDAVAIMHDDWGTRLFGMGLGRFPLAYLAYSNLSESRPTTYRYLQQGGKHILRLGSGETLYMAQRLPVERNRTYRLSLQARSRNSGARVETPLCEKQLLNSFQCVWNGFRIEADNRWHTYSLIIHSGKLGNPNPLSRRPTELSLYNPVPGTVIDLSQVQLLNPEGQNLIRNGDFAVGGDYWFFKTHDHLPWHIKNLLVEVLFEQGWLGLLSFLVLLGILLRPLLGAAWRGDSYAAVALASAAGFLTVGLFGSLFDNPRLCLLFFSILFVAATTSSAEETRLVANPRGRSPRAS